MGPSVEVRPTTEEDGEVFVAASRASAALHEPFVQPPTDQRRFEAFLRDAKTHGDQPLLIKRTTDGALVGFANLSGIVRRSLQHAQLGYAAFRPHDGQGLMFEGLALVLELAFEDLRLHRVEASIQPSNRRSRDLIRRLGFRLEGFSPRYMQIGGVWVDHERWALHAADNY